MLTGDYTNRVAANGVQIPIFDPTSQTADASGKVLRTPFSGNKIPAGKFDPISVKALAAYTANGVLKPNNGAAPGTLGYVSNNFLISSGAVVNPNTKWSVKGDHLF